VNFRQVAYLIICAASLLYLVGASARAYVPFAGPFGRSYGGGGTTAGYFHK
jgi:hypothetical protein